jgi:predicted nucleic acid-binding protein
MANSAVLLLGYHRLSLIGGPRGSLNGCWDLLRVVPTVYRDVIVIDTAAVVALLESSERFHEHARICFSEQPETIWASVNVTAHEAFTRARYAGSSCAHALSHFDLLRGTNVRVLSFAPEDEQHARAILVKYADQGLSFHDALCAAVMRRVGIYRIFSFDRDFAVLGFQLVPGVF